MNTAEWLARLAGLLALLLLVVGMSMPRVLIPEGKVPGFKSAIIALELSRSPEVARTILDVEGIREKIEKNLKRDRYFLIVYPLLYATLGLLLTQRPGRWSMALGLVAAALALAAGPLDAAENRHVLSLLAVDPQNTMDLQAAMNAAYFPSLLKWTAISASTALVSLLFFGDGFPGAIPGILLLLAGLIGLCTFFHPPCAQWSLSPFLQTVPLLAVLSWLVWPAWLLRLWH